MYEIRNLQGVSFSDIAATWNDAFVDYIVPMQTTADSVAAYFRVAAVRADCSFGAFYEGNLVGMILSSVDSLDGRDIAYDAMTGIAPQHRGKGLFSQLFEQTRLRFRTQGISQYYLEVIKTNAKAFAIYQRKGGKVTRELSFLTGKISADVDYTSGVQVEIIQLTTAQAGDKSLYRPSFSNRTVALLRNAGNYQIAIATKGELQTGVVFSQQGAVPQILFRGNADKELLLAVFTHLSQSFNQIRISNIPVTECVLIEWLQEIGFSELLRQYEMCIEI